MRFFWHIKCLHSKSQSVVQQTLFAGQLTRPPGTAPRPKLLAIHPSVSPSRPQRMPVPVVNRWPVKFFTQDPPTVCGNSNGDLTI